MTIERQHQKSGEPPTSVWTAIRLDDQGGALVLHIGLTACIRRVTRLLEGSGELFFPSCDLQVSSNPSGPSLDISVMFVGTWPSFDGAKKAVKRIAGHIDDGASDWVTRLQILADEQPARICSPDFRIDQDQLEMLCQIYIDECRRAISN